ncbi:putative reverse transcriptase domain-containing protein [Tanacetum coccineum]
MSSWGRFCLDHVEGLVLVHHDGFTLSLLDSVFLKGLRTVKPIPPKYRLGFSRVLKGALDKVICKPDDISCWLVRDTLAESASPMLDMDEKDLDLSEQNLKQCKRKICDGHYTAAVRVLSSYGIAPYNDATLQELKAKHPFKSGPSLPDIPIDHHQLITSHRCGGIRPIAVGTVWRRLVSKVSATMIGHSLDGYLDGLQFGVGGSRRVEALIHAVIVWLRYVEESRIRCPAISRWVGFCYSSPARLYYGEHSIWSCQGVQQGDPLGPLLFSLVLHTLICKIRDSFNLYLRAWYLDDDTIVGDTLVVGKVLELITEDGLRCGLHINVDKTELFWPKEDLRSRLEGVFPPNISRPLYGVKLLGGPVSVDADFSSALVTKRVSKTIGLLDTIAKINDPQCDILNYAFIASRLQSAALQTKLLRHVDIVAFGSTFDDALCVFNSAMEIDFLSNLSEVAAPKLMKKMADIYFTQVTKDVESSFCLSPRQMALWQSQREEHTSDWLRVVPISGLGQTMNGKTYRCVLCYRLGVPLFYVSKPCSACSKVFTGDVYGDHAVSCAGVIGIKHRHNVVSDTLVDICFRSGISAGKEVDIGLGGKGCAKALRPADMLLYSWEGGLDVCVDLTGSSPLTQTGMADFVPGRAVIDAAQRKRGKYMTKCAYIRYRFLPFSFSSFGKLEKDAVTLLKRVRKFFHSHKSNWGLLAVHILIGLVSIAKEWESQIVSLASHQFFVIYMVQKIDVL